LGTLARLPGESQCANAALGGMVRRMIHRLLAVGEVLWDVFPDRRKLGGAPANFACLGHRLGAAANLVSRVGDDDDGREILDRLADIGLPHDGMQIDPERPTGVVNVTLADGQPSYTIKTDAAWDYIVADLAARRLAAAADAVCFGTLAQRSPGSRDAIRTLLGAVRSSALRVLDINLRPPFVDKAIVETSLSLANVLKLNEDELPVLVRMLPLAGHNPFDQLAEISDRYALKLIILTRGAGGSVLLASGRMSEHPGKAVNVVDAVGAGDAFTATATLGYLKGWDLERINELANEVAAYVCTQAGATPAIPTGLCSQIND